MAKSARGIAVHEVVRFETAVKGPIAAGELEVRASKGFVGARPEAGGPELRVLIGKTAMVMRVCPKKVDFGGGVKEAVEGLFGSEDDSVFILKTHREKHRP